MIGLLIMLAAGDTASFVGAQELRTLCDRDRAACAYYAAGASDALDFVQRIGISKPVIYAKMDASLEQRALVVQDYLRSHPTESGSAFGVIVAALSETSPRK